MDHNFTLTQNDDSLGWTANCSCGWTYAVTVSDDAHTNDVLVSIALQHQAHVDGDADPANVE